MIPTFKDDYLRRLFRDGIAAGNRVAVCHKSGTVVYRKEADGTISATPIPEYKPPYDTCMIDDDGMKELLEGN